MKQKKTRLPARKKVAIRRVAIALAVLAVVNFFMHIGLLFPRQAIHHLEERHATGWTRTVTREWNLKLGMPQWVYLTENKNVTLFGSAHLSIYGWMAGFGHALDCTQAQAMYVGYSSMSHEENRVWYFFGRVDDPEIKTVEISLCAEEYDAESHAVLGKEVRRIESVELLEQSGRRYFLVEDTGEWDYESHSTPRPVFIGYDAAGAEVIRMESGYGSHSYFG